MRWLMLLVAGCGFRGPTAGVASGDAAVDPDAEVVISSDAAPAIDAAVAIDAPMAPPDATVQPAAPFALTGARWLLPCTAGTDHMPNPTACHAGAVTTQIAVGGATGTKWHVTARVRGVMEKMTYAGGSGAAGGWYQGGAPGDMANNYYEVAIDQPAQHYYLNAGSNNGNHSYAFDFTAAFDVAAGASVSFSANGQDGIQWMGVDQSAAAISVAGVADPVQPYDGQWARLDVMTATPF